MSPSAPHDPERVLIEAHAGGRIILIADSFRRVTGKKLVKPGGEVAEHLWELPAVVLAHGTEADPLFFYGNRAALDLFEITAAELITMPSRLSAEPVAREERARLMARVSADNFIFDYSGVRIAKSGKRFAIERATVWNLLTDTGSIEGQAAYFSDWKVLG